MHLYNNTVIHVYTVHCTGLRFVYLLVILFEFYYNIHKKQRLSLISGKWNHVYSMQLHFLASDSENYLCSLFTGMKYSCDHLTWHILYWNNNSIICCYRVSLPGERNGVPLIPVDQSVNEVDPSELFDSSDNLVSGRRSGKALKLEQQDIDDELRKLCSISY